MPTYQITDPTIGANYGVIEADDKGLALDAMVRKMGWDSYAEFEGSVLAHSGERGLAAEEVQVPPKGRRIIVKVGG